MSDIFPWTQPTQLLKRICNAIHVDPEYKNGPDATVFNARLRLTTHGKRGLNDCSAKIRPCHT